MGAPSLFFRLQPTKIVALATTAIRVKSRVLLIILNICNANITIFTIKFKKNEKNLQKVLENKKKAVYLHRQKETTR